jgi:hypothetical protein
MNTRQTFPQWLCAGTVLVLSALAHGQTPATAQAAASASAAGIAHATEPTKVESHPWQVPSPRLNAEAYFVNLPDGARIETPFLAKFGLSGGWGISPIVSPVKGKGGHHHLLVNRDLPLDFKQPLPFNEQYIHFGKGQMETVLNLEPGTYTLRLLLADNRHLPHFVYSKPTKVTVTARRKEVDPKTLVTKGISVSVDAAQMRPPLRVRFHASGLNVGYLNQKTADTGHFRLTVQPRSGKAAVMDFPNGQTEVWLSPPAGDYSLKLDMLDNANPGKLLAAPANTSVKVQ